MVFICRFFYRFFLGLALFALCTISAFGQVRIKDIVDIEGVRGNDLVGYGLVIGLDGTGDSIRNSPYTEEALSNVLERLGVNIQGSNFRPNNVAAVIITAKLPPFARKGSRIDVNIASIGDAKNLAGGTLVMTPLNAADGNVYAIAQGSVLISGFKAEGDAASITEGVPTSGTIPGGAIVEREVGFEFNRQQNIRLALRSPDFTTAGRIADIINKKTGRRIAQVLDSGTVELDLRMAGSSPANNSPANSSPARQLAMIENLSLAPAQRAKVVIDQRSGTIVLGTDVKISSVAIAKGNLSIKIAEAPIVSQPNPFSPGQSIVLPRTSIEVNDARPGNIAMIESNITLPDLVAGLNALGVSPREMIDILKTMKTAGALHAELVLQ